jgi:microcystin-dependent protein
MLAFIGQIALFPYGFTPAGWAECDGSGVAKARYQALYSLIGTAYGGGPDVFLLPDLRGCAAVGFSAAYPIGQRGGAEGVVLTEDFIPPHVHSLNACSSAGKTNDPSGAVLANAVSGGLEPDKLGLIYNPAKPTSQFGNSIQPAGSQKPHNNMQPSLALRYCICLDGIYPQPGA